MSIVTLDFETYFSDDYTLKKMTTESYVRDPRFKVHCAGIKPGNELTQAGLSFPCLNPNEQSFVAHHAHFDGLILSHIYGVAPTFWFDTMCMARLLWPHESVSLKSVASRLGLPDKTVPYESMKNIRDLPPELYAKVAAGCANDVELTYVCFQKMLPYIPREELRIIDLTIRMFTEPSLRLDRGLLQKYLVDTREQKAELLAQCGATAKDVRSADRFAALLHSLGVEAPTKISQKTGKKTYALAKTDQGLKDLLDHPDPRVGALIEARLGVKSNMVQTRAERMLGMDERGAMCVYLNYCGAHTLRWSGGDLMNWQNFKRKSAVREAVRASLGYVVVVVDASQIEARLLDCLAGQWDMLDKFRQKADIYSEIASQFYGEHVDKTQPDKRGMGKQIILSCGFGAGADSIKNTARIGTYGPPVFLTDAQAVAARDLYRSTHPMVKKLWKFASDVVLPALLSGGSDFAWGPMRVKGKRIYMPDGAWIDYTNLGYDGKEYYQTRRGGRQKTYGGKLVQNVIEGLSRTILAHNTLKIAERYKVVTLTHDEIVYLAPEDAAEQAYQYGLELVKTSPVWMPQLPLDAEGGYAINYSK